MSSSPYINGKSSPYMALNTPNVPNAPQTEHTAVQQSVASVPPTGVFSEQPIKCVCFQCGATILARATKENGILTWLLCGGLLLIGCWCGCCLIPFCVDSVKDTVHYCPQCSTTLGRKKVL
ncbi:unnamed protein product [Rotaria socialis]|uniref:LITAF domain-containing protein n=2 Tax=Rotaria socialis TaxID=392032 RepID=A0A820BJD4_9BILA|nr:unnamed protein product [Rotaria socialis]CAF4201615.1 unnamed protein product [Rotaria socialis]